jgi:hypothetical protein
MRAKSEQLLTPANECTSFASCRVALIAHYDRPSIKPLSPWTVRLVGEPFGCKGLRMLREACAQSRVQGREG